MPGHLRNLPQIEYPAIGVRGCVSYEDQAHFGYPLPSARLLEFCSMDVVFVAIDFENPNAIFGKPPQISMSAYQRRSKNNCQAGIAILDTRDLDKTPETVVTAQQFCSGKGWYSDIIPTKLLFGTSETVTLQAMSKRLTEMLRFVDPITNTLRPIVVIGHALNPNSDVGDIACLEKLTDASIRSPIVDYLDTSESRGVLYLLGCQLGLESRGLSWFKHPNLRQILEYLGIPYANLHVAANDAMFALRAALMLAVRDRQNMDQELTVTERKIIPKLEGIALLPLSAPPRVKLAKDAFGSGPRRLDRVAKSLNKYQIKQTEAYKQEKISLRSEPGRMKMGDWADLNDFAFPWESENEDISTPLDGGTLISLDGESLLDARSSDESSDSGESSGCMRSSDEESGEGKAGSCQSSPS